MISGTMNTFQKIWKLVRDVSQVLETPVLENAEPASFSREDYEKMEKLGEEWYRTRNYQLSVVRKLIFFRLLNWTTFPSFHILNYPKYLQDSI